MSRSTIYDVERELRTAAVVISVQSIVCVVCGVYFLSRWVALTYRRRHDQRVSRWAWNSLPPTLLLFIAQHTILAVAGFRDMLKIPTVTDGNLYFGLGFYGPNIGLQIPALATQLLFSVFELATCRIAFWEVLFARRRKAFKASRQAAWLVTAFDLLFGIATVAMAITTVSLGKYYGLCWENDCGNSTQLSLISIRNAMFSFGFPAILLVALLGMIISFYLFAKWTPLRPGNHLSSPLARSMFRVVGPVLGFQLVATLTVILVHHTDNDYHYWRVSYAALPYWIVQVVALALMIQVISRTPVFVDPESLLDRDGSQLVLARPGSGNRGGDRFSAESPQLHSPFPPGLEPSVPPYQHPVEIGLPTQDDQILHDSTRPYYREKTALEVIDEESEFEDSATATGRRTSGS